MVSPLARDDVVLVESLAPDDDGARLAALLADAGHDASACTIDEIASRPFDVLLCDVWTPAIAPHVLAARAAGRRVLSVGELVLRNATCPTVGITGTAGKSSTCQHLVDILAASGRPALVGSARLGNAWPGADLLARVLASGGERTLVAELTSSHLAFMDAAPTVAVVTSFWPDHVELHGSLASYRDAKLHLVRRQRPSDWLVSDAGARSLEPFATASAARRAWFSTSRPVPRGAYVDERGRAVLAWDDGRHPIGDTSALAADGRRLGNVLAACVAARICGASPAAIADGVARLEPVPYRRSDVLVARGVTVIDDGMAATPAKASAAIAATSAQRLVLLAGGDDRLSGAAVHASPEEAALLRAAADAAATRCARAVLFGPAARRLAPLLEARGLADVEQVAGLAEATERALLDAPPGTTVLFAPMFPVSADDRRAFAALARRAAGC